MQNIWNLHDWLCNVLLSKTLKFLWFISEIPKLLNPPWIELRFCIKLWLYVIHYSGYYTEYFGYLCTRNNMEFNMTVHIPLKNGDIFSLHSYVWVTSKYQNLCRKYIKLRKTVIFRIFAVYHRNENKLLCILILFSIFIFCGNLIEELQWNSL